MNIDVKPTLDQQQWADLSTAMPQIEQALYHAEQAGIKPEARLIDLVHSQATYSWLTGRLGLAHDDFTRAFEMSKEVFGTEHPKTIIIGARLEAMNGELAASN